VSTSWRAVRIDELQATNGLFLLADIGSIVAAALAVVWPFLSKAPTPARRRLPPRRRSG
jgi:hypothetical protein